MCIVTEAQSVHVLQSLQSNSKNNNMVTDFTNRTEDGNGDSIQGLRFLFKATPCSWKNKDFGVRENCQQTIVLLRVIELPIYLQLYNAFNHMYLMKQMKTGL